jgi:hypothetical protein
MPLPAIILADLVVTKASAVFWSRELDIATVGILPEFPFLIFSST